MTPDLKARLAALSDVASTRPKIIRLNVRGDVTEHEDNAKIIAATEREKAPRVRKSRPCRSQGERRYPSCILTIAEEEALLLCSETDIEIAERFGIGVSSVSKIRRHYGAAKPTRVSRRRQMLAQAQQARIDAKAARKKAICDSQLSASELAQLYGVGEHAIWRIWREADRSTPTKRGRPRRVSPKPAST